MASRSHELICGARAKQAAYAQALGAFHAKLAEAVDAENAKQPLAARRDELVGSMGELDGRFELACNAVLGD